MTVGVVSGLVLDVQFDHRRFSEKCPCESALSQLHDWLVQISVETMISSIANLWAIAEKIYFAFVHSTTTTSFLFYSNIQ